MSVKITPMSPETLRALHGSIKKWERIVASPRALDKGQDNCPLCKEFFNFNCDGCPVAERTGRWNCRGSPYAEWTIHQENVHRHYGHCYRAPGCKTCLRLAKAELTFLRSPLPK